MSNPINPREQPNAEQVKAALSQQLIQLIAYVHPKAVDELAASQKYSKMGLAANTQYHNGQAHAYQNMQIQLERYLKDIRK